MSSIINASSATKMSARSKWMKQWTLSLPKSKGLRTSARFGRTTVEAICGCDFGLQVTKSKALRDSLPRLFRAGALVKRLSMPALFLALMIAASRACAQHEEHQKPASKVEKPVVFMDKSPRIIAYQLARLSNEQLLLVDRDTSDPKFVPVYQAILTRTGIPATYRQEAVGALAKLNKTSEPTELLTAIKRLDAAQTAVLGELAKM